jgi:hypothetical protein
LPAPADGVAAAARLVVDKQPASGPGLNKAAAKPSADIQMEIIGINMP